MEDNKILISFKKADIMNGESTVLFGLDMEVRKGDFIYIVGKVGTGKTSIIRTIIAENELHEGSGTACGYDLTTIKAKDIPMLRRKIGVVFQDFQLLMDRDVEKNLEFVLRATGWTDEERISKRIAAVLAAVGMSHKIYKMPHQLSGGEQQRIAIARALLNAPELIVADEPTGNLDEETAEGIMKLLNRINKEVGTAIVMVTHNRNICKRWPGIVYECRNETAEPVSPANGADGPEPQEPEAEEPEPQEPEAEEPEAKEPAFEAVNEEYE